jgi:RNA polymerase sigma-70 factor, ECF subfamily
VDRFSHVSDEQVLSNYLDRSRPSGDREAAFHELVRRFQHRLFAVCMRVLGSPVDAEDAVQETFVKLARHAEGFREEAKLSTWLYRVARNVCTDRVRYEARRPATPVDDITEVADEPDPSDHLAAHDTATVVRAALDQLDEQSRTLLLLVSVDGLSYAEAAEVADLPVGTVKSRVSRARVQLGELLAAADDDATERSSAGSSDAVNPLPPRELEARGPPDT